MPATALQLRGRYLTISHIAEACSVKESTVSQWLWAARHGQTRKNDTPFPEPDVKVGHLCQLWTVGTVKEWAKLTGRRCDVR